MQIAEIDATDETAPYVAKTYRRDPSEPVATRPLALTLWTREGTARETLYYAHDLRKNVVSLFDAKGLRRASYQYDPYGNITSMEGDMAEENPFRFSSEHHDEDLGLVYYNYRHYNPTDGRWISRDPIAEQGGWNLYGFVNNNAMGVTDQLGLSTDANSVVITVERHSVIKNVGVYSIITVQLPKISLSKSDKDGKLCSRFSGKKLTFYGIESYEAWRLYHFDPKKQGPGLDFIFNHLDPNKTHVGRLRRENGDLNNIETTKDGGYTCIIGRTKRLEDRDYNLNLPNRPNCMSESTYRTIYEAEISLGDGGINIHAGETANRHSTECIIIGTSLVDGGFNYQESLQNDFILKTAIYCARRVKKGAIKTRANDITEQIECTGKIEMPSIITNDIPDFTI
ncbi:RHS repeat-associated core domain-containing protein [Akkermansia glycaniphila]|uniref:RHS repeat-associated core domain-containing protein n=1 Tax=Akkermansia glycaniphila TaxID=1679444 RepID=UPI001C02966E|nr:RHS repeat-associated core domain-containing protein [Akkermansia glycaniphila]